LGFEECWRDDWLWGHQGFRKVCEAKEREKTRGYRSAIEVPLLNAQFRHGSDSFEA
jgi:hypothetical protein